MKISIITVTYNSAKTITNCISSINNQTYSDIEQIIIDGNSTDNTIPLINSLQNRVTRIISEPDEGIYFAMNKGINFATGDIIGMLNSDDQFFNSESLSEIANCFENPKVDAVYGNLVYTDEKNKLIRTWNSKPFRSGLFSQSWSPAHPTFYCKREIYKKYGLYKTEYKIAADVELMLRYMEVHKIHTYFIDKVLVNMRSGGISNKGIQSTIIITNEMRRAFKENGLFLNLPKYLFYKGLKIKEYFRKI
jgi:glycosyltransferase involved in cell wall biosynthesis